MEWENFIIQGNQISSLAVIHMGPVLIIIIIIMSDLYSAHTIVVLGALPYYEIQY